MKLNTNLEVKLNSAIKSPLLRFEPVAAEQDKVKVEWDWCGEGNSGDYQPDDPEDNPLLRFTVYYYEGVDWTEIEDSSYCTLIPISTSEEVLGKLARYILDKVKDEVIQSHKIKKICERLSWIKIEDVPDEENFGNTKKKEKRS